MCRLGVTYTLRNQLGENIYKFMFNATYKERSNILIFI